MSVCPSSLQDIGLVRDVLSSVDCNVQFYSAAGYKALTGPASPLPAALTALLTIYVAILGYQMLFGIGRTRLADTPLIAVKIGAILAVALNWTVFQTLVFDLDAQAPLQIGRLISRPMAAGEGSLARRPIDGVQTAYDELMADASELAKKAAQGATVASAAPSPVGASGAPIISAASEPQGDATATANGLRRAAAALVGSTAGVLAMAFIATGVLTAIGPIFIALFMFEATRGFFVGWVRALVGVMLTPMVCWVTTCLMLVVLSPRIDTLSQQRQAHDIKLDAADAASTVVLIFAAAQLALVVGGLVVAGGFQLGRRTVPAGERAPGVTEVRSGPIVVETRSRAQVLASSLQSSALAYSRETGGAGAPGEGVRVRLEGGGADTSVRAFRLGETYRRSVAMRDRSRVGAAGRA